MNTISISLQQLRGMIGVEVLHNGVRCQIIEVLEDGPSIVLQSQHNAAIQANQHGDAHRRTPQTFTIPVLTANKTELHNSFLQLDLI